MNVFGKNERSWRKARKRGVSPIIATILLVAITVVLAAVLYVLISGLTGGGVGSKPIGGAFTAGNPILSTCAAGSVQTAVAASTGGCHVGDYIYTLTVESSTITFGSALFEVKTSAGGIYTPAAGGATDSFSLLNINQQVVAVTVTGGAMAMSTTWATYQAAANLYCNGAACSTSTSLTGIYTIVVDVGTSAPSGTGLMFVALGTGGYSGTTSLALP